MPWLKYSCGHHSSFYEDSESEALCYECKKKRIGEVIQFVRYGNFPPDGKSQNHRDRTSEGGISVYEIVNGKPQYTGWYFGITERKKVIHGTGKIVGWGSDGEPLVSDIKIARNKKTKPS